MPELVLLVLFIQAFLIFVFQSLSRKELRPLRQNLARRKELKRCGKRIQLHCDPNNDMKINESEWLTCIIKQTNGEF